MSRRKRHVEKQSKDIQIGWLQHRTGYPSAEERQKILVLREELSAQLIYSMVSGAKPDKAQTLSLIRKYGREEVQHAIRKLENTVGQMPAFIADDAKSYREYRHRYARFGAGLKFYASKEIDELYKANLNAVKESNNLAALSELNRLLLFGWRDWEDLTPPAIPPRPDDFITPQPASYPAPVHELFEWGAQLDQSHDFVADAKFIQWRRYIPALTRMALDPGLLNGWPTEPGSWAPWHAIHMLGTLEAWESAPALAELADMENDWLSDHLPHIWAEMGRQVEPSLWMILENASATEKKRGLAAEALQMMAQDDEAIHNKVVRGFEKMLKNTKIFNPTVNAYLIHFLNHMDVADEIQETIQQTFDEQRVDLAVITPEDMDGDDWDDWDDEVEEEE